MKAFDEKIWQFLMEDEKMALGLQYGMDKSSWQAGEIMAKSHYKYLEISYRAKKFIKMFKDYIDLFGEMIPDYIQGDEVVKKYLRLCITKRAKPGEIIPELGVKKKQLDTKIIETMKLWSDPEHPNEFYTYELVKEFDRWNNFRILPEPIREPSAYKRRVKNNYKRQVKMLGQLSPLAIEKITQICKAYRNFPSKAYLPLISKGKPIVLQIKNNPITIKLLTEINLYAFTSKPEAEKYINSVSKYISVKLRECTDGLEFWPTYRELIKKAVNYNEIQKITPTRKYLEMAMKNLEFYNQK